ncbi:MAG: YgfZ/GcvT domain-containing protein [Thermoleophilaceae bacterium]
MRRSQTRFVQSGGSESTISWKSSASATRSSLAGLPRIGPVTVATEYELLRGSAGVVDRSERGKLLLTGAEAAEFLQGQLTNDIESLAPGSGCYAALLTHKGKLLTDMRVLRGEDWIWLDTEAAALPALAKNVRMYSIGRDVQARDVTAERAILSLIGPAARDALDVAPPATEHSFVEGEHGVYVATDLGVDVICDAADAGGVRAALGVDEVSPEAAELLRVESGRPRLGVDMDGDTIPQEAGLNARAVSFTKGCYVGQETVARLHYKGKPNRHLRGLRLSAPAASGDPIVLGDREVGRIGSVAQSPRLGALALAIVRREASPGDTVLVGDERAVAELVELPFPD